MSISGLYYNYDSVKEDEIKKYLKTIKIVKQKDIGNGLKYYPLSIDSMTKIINKPRQVSLTFDAFETNDTYIDDLVEFKEVTYLVKSSSRFFLKPDIGEVFDQIYYQDLFHDKVKAILLMDGYELLPDTEGEHFLMKAVLLKSE